MNTGYDVIGAELVQLTAGYGPGCRRMGPGG